MRIKMTRTLTVHPKNIGAKKVILGRLEIIGMEQRVTYTGKEQTFLAVGDLAPILVDLRELKQVEACSIRL